MPADILPPWGSAMRFLATAVMSSLVLTGNVFAEPSVMPLSEVLTTSGQEGMRQVAKEFTSKGIEAVEDRRTKHHLSNIFKASRDIGASNAFLADATNLHDAVRASTSVFAGCRSADTPTAGNHSHPVRGSHWLVAFLGCGHSDPLRWEVEGVEVSGDKLRLSYREPEPSIATADVIPYYYWAPLGKLDTGTYEVELYDADKKAVTLMRRVVVEHQQ